MNMEDIFEDEITQLMNSKVNFDVCMLAYNLQRSDKILGCDFLLQVSEAQTASAYIVGFPDKRPQFIFSVLFFQYMDCA